MEWVGLVEAPDQITAEMWSELLHGNDVPSFTNPSSAGGIYGGAQLGPMAATGCWVMVREGDFEKASEILRPIVQRMNRPRRRRKRS